MSLAQVKEFHEAFGHPVSEERGLIPEERLGLRLGLILEELEETVRDSLNEDLIKSADGLSDLSVVTNGALLEFGFVEVDVDGEEYYVLDEKKAPRTPTLRELVTLCNLVYESITSIDKAYGKNDVNTIIDELIRIKWWVAVVAMYCNIPLEEIDKAVHKANMSKLGEDGKPIYRESDNKILKGPNFRPPEEDIEAILREHGAEL